MYGSSRTSQQRLQMRGETDHDEDAMRFTQHRTVPSVLAVLRHTRRESARELKKGLDGRRRTRLPRGTSTGLSRLGAVQIASRPVPVSALRSSGRLLDLHTSGADERGGTQQRGGGRWGVRESQVLTS